MNLNEKPTREKYKEFCGKNTEQMELLIKDKRVPLSVKQIIERRLNSNQEDWKNNYFDTCDAVVRFKDKFKIIKNCQILKQMNSETKLKDYGISITEEQYKKLKDKEFEINAPKEEVCKYLFEGLYEKYLKFLGFCPVYYITDYELNMRAFYVYGLADRSGVCGRNVLGSGSGRFVGLASEMRK